MVPVDGVATGTMDALCCTKLALIDFKTGQVRDYKAQMAAYALACMDTFFANTWTAHLLFIDQQLVITHEFTEDEARALVEGIVNAPAEATSCEYCSWCARFGTCPITRTQAAEVMAVANARPDGPTTCAKARKDLPPALDEIAADDRLAWEFLNKLNAVNKWGDVIKAKLRERVEEAEKRGEKNAYFTLTSRRGRKVFPARAFDHVIGEIGNMAVLSILGPASVEAARELWAKSVSRIPFPEELIVEQGSCRIFYLKPAKALPQQ